MILERIHAAGFGRLKDLIIEDPGRRLLIVGANGAGKSTLAAFVLAVLYGMPASRSGSQWTASGDPRRAYRPWDGGRMGGSLDIRLSDRLYRIEAWFGDAPRQDRCRIWCLSSGAELALGKGETPGERLLGLKQAVFQSTVLAGSGMLHPSAVADRQGERRAFLSAAVRAAPGHPPAAALDAEPGSGIGGAFSESDRSVLTPAEPASPDDPQSGASGQTAEQAIRLLRRQAALLRSPRGDRGRIPDLSAQLALLEDEARRLTARDAACSAYEETAESLSRQLAASERQLSDCLAADRAASEREQAELAAGLDAVQAVRAASNAPGAGTEKDGRAGTAGRERPVRRFGFTAVPGLLALLAGVWFQTAGTAGIWAWVLTGGGLLLLLSFWVGRHPRRARGRDGGIGAVDPDAAGRPEAGADTAMQTLSDLEQDLIEQYSRFGARADARRAEADRLRARRDALAMAWSRAEGRRLGLDETVRPIVPDAQREQRMHELRRAIAAAEREYRALQLAAEHIELAAAELAADYFPQIRRHLQIWLPRVSGGRMTDAAVDDRLSVRVHLENPAAPHYVEPEQLSAATREQTGFALRLAMLDLSLESGREGAAAPLPVWMDMPFAGWDESRTAAAVDCLEMLSDQAGRQVILMTESRSLAAALVNREVGWDAVFLPDDA